MKLQAIYKSQHGGRTLVFSKLVHIFFEAEEGQADQHVKQLIQSTNKFHWAEEVPAFNKIT